VYAPASFAEALVLMLIGMVCWGSWANTHRITKDWRFELYYWDYTFGIVFFGLLFALTLGTLFGSPTFLENLRAADRAAWAFAAGAGFLWNIGNLLLLGAITLVGITVAFPVAVGIALILSVVTSYMVMPRGNPTLLTLGVGLILAAVLVNAFAYRAAATGTKRMSRAGLWMCIVAGVLIAIPAPFTARAFSVARPLSSYGVMVLFTFGALLVTLVMLPLLMRRPISGTPLAAADYGKGNRFAHGMGLAGALVWATGTVLNFIGAQKVGVALAVAIGQANPLVAALWGVFLWKEFRGAPRRSHWLLVAMFALYIAGLVVLSRAG
jgi:glucose uptake protein